MKIYTLVKPSAKQDKINVVDESHFEIWTKAPAKENKANQATARLLASHFNIPKTSIELLRGAKSNHKVFIVKYQ
jgi:uncharacterized protein YggU (UPF0235/DUF167 family)